MITVAGEALIDLVIDGSGSVTAVPGGAPFNVARMIARLGADCQFLGRLSDDGFGEQLRAALVHDGVRIAVPDPTPAPTTLAIARHEAIREITIELRDKEHADALAIGLGDLEGVSVVWFHDRAFLAHDGGKIKMVGRYPINTNQDVRDVYTPGVARVASAISEHPQLAGRFTMIGRSVAICTNGSRVLGLGDIGPVPSMPVMEGKALFYAQLVDITAVPILVDTKDVDEFVETVVRISPGFGGIHLEDISAPECFEIERRLIEALPQPVMHDDVHGTAVVGLAAAIGACRQAGIDLRAATVGQLGLGAAGLGIAALMVEGGAGQPCNGGTLCEPVKRGAFWTE